ncbi:MAG: DUF1799 domain-containing protein [Burkholderiales bacterium]
MPPKLPEWLDEVWQLYERVRTQWRTSLFGREGLDYNPAIALVQSVGAGRWLWKILELLRVIEAEAMRMDGEGDDGR